MEHPLNSRPLLNRAASSGRLPGLRRPSLNRVESTGRLLRRPSLNRVESSRLLYRRSSLNQEETNSGLLLRRRPAHNRTMSNGLLQQPLLNRTESSSGLLLRRRQTAPENIAMGYLPRLEHVFDATSVPASPMRTSFAEAGVPRQSGNTAPAETGPPSPSRRKLYRQDWEADNPLAFSSGYLQHSSRLFSKAELDIWGPQSTRKEDPKWQKRKMEIIKDLLGKFSLEKTFRKYECLEPMEYRLDQRCFSVHCAAESEVIRKRMLYLMGTDVCRINDKKFIEKLQVRVQDEYEKEQESKERQLAEKERQRQRRLISEGVMTAEQLRKQDSTKWRKTRRTRTPPPGEEQDRKLVQEKARPITYHDKKDKDKEKHKGSKEEENKQKKEDEEGDNESQKEKGDDEKKEGEENGAEGENPEGEDGKNQNGTEEEGVKDEEEERDDSEGWHCDSDRPNYKARNDDPLIKKLRHQETTGGIYHTADEVLMGESCGGDCEF